MALGVQGALVDNRTPVPQGMGFVSRPANALWSATMTVGSNETAGLKGFASGTGISGGPAFGELSGDDFGYGAQTYTVREIHVDEDGDLLIDFDEDLSASATSDLILYMAGQSFRFAASTANGSRYCVARPEAR